MFSLLALLGYADAKESGTTIDTARPKRRVIGVDVDIRLIGRTASEANPMARIELRVRKEIHQLI